MVCSYGLKNRLWRFAMFLLLSVSGQREVEHSVSIGDQACRLMKEYGNSVLRLAYSYLHNMSDAEDVLQDTLTAGAFRGIGLSCKRNTEGSF